MSRKKLGELLLEAGVIDETSLRAGLHEQQRGGGSLGRRLIDMRLIEERDLVDALSRQLACPTVDLDQVQIPRAVLDLVPGEFAEQHGVIPIAQQMQFLDLAMADVTNAGVVDALRVRTRLNIRPYIAGPRAIERAIARHYNRGVGAGIAHMPGGELQIETEPLPRRTARLSAAPPPGPSGATPAAHGAATLPSEGMRPFPRQSQRTEAQPDPAERLTRDLAALQERVAVLEANLGRDEEVLRRILALLVDKDVATREEILERIRG